MFSVPVLRKMYVEEQHDLFSLGKAQQQHWLIHHHHRHVMAVSVQG